MSPTTPPSRTPQDARDRTRRRIVVVGAGAIGGLVAAELHLAGHEVAAVARGAHLAAMQADGLAVRSPEGTRVVPLACHGTVAEADVGPGDLVVVATKAHQAEPVLDDLLAAAGPSVPLACATNGVEVERLALRRFEVVLGMLVNVPAVHLEPGLVEVYARRPRGLLDVGAYPSGMAPEAEALAAALTDATFTSRATADVMALKWAKLLGNVGNVCQVLCGTDRSRYERLYRVLRQEAEVVVKAAGITVDLPTQQHRATLVAREDIDGRRRPGGSTWQSAVRGTGDLEVVTLNGEITLLGRLHGLPTPANALVQVEALRLVAEGRPVGSLDQDVLLARAADAAT